jgi:hypothetical protein
MRFGRFCEGTRAILIIQTMKVLHVAESTLTGETMPARSDSPILEEMLCGELVGHGFDALAFGNVECVVEPCLLG